VPTHVLLLRGINLGARNRVAMPRLRELLAGAGFDDVRTYLQSGNVVLAGKGKPDAVATRCERLIERELGLDITVVARTRADLQRVVRQDPLGKVADDPKRYQVTFLAARLDREGARKVQAAATEPEEVVIAGREIYAWHPKGVARSRLWALLAGSKLGVAATSRNWTTVTKLLELASGS
jgi:uncharacterized protein (DUF1697 family)